MDFKKFVQQNIDLHQKMLVDEQLQRNLQKAFDVLQSALQQNKAVLVCGNGGSASDAMHFAGEMVGRYLRERAGIPFVSLSADNASITAIGNDYGYEYVFSRQVEAYRSIAGALIAISTSGNSKNVLYAVEMAQKHSIPCIALTRNGGKLNDICEISIAVDAPNVSYQVQQLHLSIYHYLCGKLEDAEAEMLIPIRKQNVSR